MGNMVKLILDTIKESHMAEKNKLISSRALSEKTPLDMLFSQPTLNKELAATFIKVMIDEDQKKFSVDAAITFNDPYQLRSKSISRSCAKSLCQILRTICQSDNAKSLMWFLETKVEVNTVQNKPKELLTEALQKSRDSRHNASLMT